MGRLEGKVAIVTGAGSGIGEATARRFAAEGAHLLVQSRQASKAEATVAAIRDAGGTAASMAGDLSEETLIRQVVEAAMDRFGRIDILFNNAALTGQDHQSQDRTIVDTDAAIWDRTLSVNLRAPALMCKYAIPHMVAGGGGSILFSGSGRGSQGDMLYTAYAASKAALYSLTQNIAAQFGKKNIRANLIVIGLILTDALRDAFPPEKLASISKQILSPTIGTPDDIASAALFLASDEARYINGQQFMVDGGIMSHSPLYAENYAAMNAGH